MITFDYDKKYRRARLVADIEILGLVRNHFSVNNPDSVFANKKLKLQGSTRKVPSRQFLIGESGLFDFGMYNEIRKYLISEQITEIEYTQDFVDRLKVGFSSVGITDSLSLPLRDYQEEVLHKAFKMGCGTIVIGTGGGKCYRAGTELINYDGDTVLVENLSIGDELMGPDSTPRTITSLITGYDDLYEITPYKYSNSVVVNSEHLLVLKISNIGTKRVTDCNGKKYKTGDILTISVKDYLLSSKTFKHYTKWFHSGTIRFKASDSNLKISPYLLGFWLGDGSRWGGQISKTEEYHDTIKTECEKCGYILNVNMTDSSNNVVYNISKGFVVDLKNLNLIRNKHIPIQYLKSSETDRMELLSGLLDSDGSVHKTGFEFTNTNKNIIDGVVFLSRSLGMAVSPPSSRITKSQDGTLCKSWRIHINTLGKCNTRVKIPPSRKMNKEIGITGFNIRNVGVGKYYGFELGGVDGKHLLSDFSVVHNSLVQASLLENWKELQPEFKCLLVVPGLGLVSQLLKDFEDYKVTFSYSGWTGGPDGMPLQKTQVVIVNTENLCSQFGKFTWLTEVDLVLNDECHKLKDSNKLTKYIGKITTPNKFGFTGTLPKTENDRWKIIGTFGPVIYEKKSKALRDEGYLANASVKLIKVNHKIKRFNYKQEIEYLETLDERNDLIVKLGSKMTNNVLILVNHLEHGHDLLKRFQDNDPNRSVYFVYGEMPVEERMKIIELMENNSDIICIAMSSIFSIGVNIKNLHYVVFTFGGKSFIRTIQSIGRGLRLHESKEKLVIFDIYDNMKYSMSHADERIKYYEEEEVPWSEVEVKLNL